MYKFNIDEFLINIPEDKKGEARKYFENLEKESQEFIDRCNRKQNDLDSFKQTPVQEKSLTHLLFLIKIHNLSRLEITNILQEFSDEVNISKGISLTICPCQSDVPIDLVPWGQPTRRPDFTKIDTRVRKECMCSKQNT